MANRTNQEAKTGNKIVTWLQNNRKQIMCKCSKCKNLEATARNRTRVRNEVTTCAVSLLTAIWKCPCVPVDSLLVLCRGLYSIYTHTHTHTQYMRVYSFLAFICNCVNSRGSHMYGIWSFRGGENRTLGFLGFCAVWYGVVVEWRRFGGPCCFHLQGGKG